MVKSGSFLYDQFDSTQRRKPLIKVDVNEKSNVFFKLALLNKNENIVLLFHFSGHS